MWSPASSASIAERRDSAGRERDDLAFVELTGDKRRTNHDWTARRDRIGLRLDSFPLLTVDSPAPLLREANFLATRRDLLVGDRETRLGH
jgi:hypothetical protein